MATTVISVRGMDRNVLLADPTFVYVGRRCAGWPASPFGNPFKPTTTRYEAWIEAGGHEDEPDDERPIGADHALRLFATLLRGATSGDDALPKFVRMARLLPTLRGKTLGCWCCVYDGVSVPMPLCHAAVLARMANGLEVRIS